MDSGTRAMRRLRRRHRISGVASYVPDSPRSAHPPGNATMASAARCRVFFIWFGPITVGELPASAAEPAKASTYDVVVYGGTSGGVVAAYRAATRGKSVVLV